MAIDTTARRTRRALLTAATTAAAAMAIGRAIPARAADTDPVTLGDETLNSTSLTRITNTTNDDTVFHGSSTHAGVGVYGTSDTHRGVAGSSPSGVGLYGETISGHALQTSGRIKANRVSGVATIAAGATTKTVNPGVDIVSGSFVLLTPMANLGGRDLWFTKNATADTFTIRMSSSRSSPTKVAWLLLG